MLSPFLNYVDSKTATGHFISENLTLVLHIHLQAGGMETEAVEVAATLTPEQREVTPRAYHT